MWRHWTAQAWQGRLPPNRIISRGWAAAGGSNFALRQVLVSLWKQYCFQEGIADGDCPMVGVFDQAYAASSSSTAPARST